MPVEVSFHPETFEEFFLPVDAKHPGLSEVLKSEFLRYMESRRQLIPSIFGRDVPYTQPPLAFQACLMHIHICIPPALFPKNVPQHDRVCKMGRPGDDAALIYVQGELYEDRYLILAFLWPDAHTKARDISTMQYLARLAKEWRDNN
ncbi:type II toxin-antitoxin system YafO family toxin [Pseudomonas asiatica]|uniref:type II toxin-antitoxin system YafO family toxin n=1 Tax=Pseudomonas asiatica TaxID=2219225 RepID=UPI00209AA4A0|nr:type II toxin-antitoxin system YafO family toxin [Pseudomonas asiatica]MCO7536315.1 type II toxin-antitoxin system YafO family toxin [Pseudomonas asiatica]MCO7550775.1 type II toxin-antitoxin system YafO family toxin [Pseudomonas asiatica]MCO7561799.1 type II toxin-antitoxin system YafO family toxin [Pseudomonas asiatica]